MPNTSLSIESLGLEHANDYESEYLFNEIFVEEVYLQNGIQLDEASTVVDIGANIGLFSLHAHMKYGCSRIVACEPIPAVFEILRRNLTSCGPGLELMNVAISDYDGTVGFSYYPGYSVISGCHANREIDSALLMAGGGVDNDDDEDEEVRLLIRQRMQDMQSLEVDSITLSSLINELALVDIDLLKIDAEKSEISIINGIVDEHWQRIHQLVVEIHGKSRAAELANFLKSKGMEATIEADSRLGSHEVANLYARRV